MLLVSKGSTNKFTNFYNIIKVATSTILGRKVK